MQATITSKGQVTLPKAIREKFQLEPGDRIEFVFEHDNLLRVAPVTSPVTQLKGMLPKPAVPATLQEMDEAIAKAATDEA
ncbi:MAG: AbrB/MazE/SpoVT family DNA-binding domain-containing protein [Gammaproteobacteria bacterium]|nr:AbrB/MazE/SpoVT family DNA-binding domain-containing protein [Gammaproteobacteria bacterium]